MCVLALIFNYIELKTFIEGICYSFNYSCWVWKYKSFSQIKGWEDRNRNVCF